MLLTCQSVTTRGFTVTKGATRQSVKMMTKELLLLIVEETTNAKWSSLSVLCLVSWLWLFFSWSFLLSRTDVVVDFQGLKESLAAGPEDGRDRKSPLRPDLYPLCLTTQEGESICHPPFPRLQIGLYNTFNDLTTSFHPFTLFSSFLLFYSDFICD